MGLGGTARNPKKPKREKMKRTETEDDDGRQTDANGVVREGVWKYGILGGKKRIR